MNLINFIVGLAAGTMIGWFASRLVEGEYKRTHRLIPGEYYTTELG
jgi:hypothetical protein